MAEDELIKAMNQSGGRQPVGSSTGEAVGAIGKASRNGGPDIEALGAKAGEYRAKAGTAARDAASSGKDVAADALHALSDAARGMADKLSGESGDYVRRAANSVDRFSDQLRDRSLDELAVDARGAMREHPAIAVGAAAVIGFALARFLRSGGSGGNRA